MPRHCRCPRADEDARRAPSEGPRGWSAAVGLLLLVLGLGAMALGVIVQYGDINGPNDARLSRNVAYLWVPGAVAAAIGLGVLIWAWWCTTHGD